MNSKFVSLLEQSSSQLENQYFNAFFNLYFKRPIDSYFDYAESSLKKILSIIRDKRGSEILQYDKEKSFEYADLLKERLKSFENLVFVEKFKSSYSFFKGRVLIPYIRIEFLEYNKFNIPESIIKDVAEHDFGTETNSKISVPILYLKIRPFVVSDKRVVVVEEIQSTVISALEQESDYLNDPGAEEYLSEIIKEIKQIVQQRVNETIEFLYNNCDALYLVRKGVPKHQRFLYQNYEQFRCGDPFKNKNFISVVSPIIFENPKSKGEKEAYYSFNHLVNEDYKYLYCIKEIEDSDISANVNALLSYFFGKINGMRRKIYIKVLTYNNITGDKLFLDLINLYFKDLNEKFGLEAYKFVPHDPSIWYFNHIKDDDIVKLIQEIDIAGDIFFKREEGRTGEIDREAYKTRLFDFESKLDELNRLYVSQLDILGVKPEIKFEPLFRGYATRNYNSISVYIMYTFKYSVYIDIKNILRRTGIKNV